MICNASQRKIWQTIKNDSYQTTQGGLANQRPKIIFLGGKNSYLRLPMGITGLPDICQAKMPAQVVALEIV